MDSEYGTMFKQLMNERNELRKYIVDICELLGIDTSQSILGANCLEFYAVLCSTAENKIKDLQEQLKRKEQECEELKQWKNGAENLFKAQIDNPDKIIIRCKQALAEIKEIAKENTRIADLEGLNGAYRRGLATQILQKISEVLENE